MAGDALGLLPDGQVTVLDGAPPEPRDRHARIVAFVREHLSPQAAGEVPQPADATGPYLFVSYKREDVARVLPHLETLAAAGVGFWYDKGIPGGAEWDAMIEKRLRGCELVLLFLSRASAASKHVRREVKFADKLDKPILTVVLEPTELGQGLDMLLSQYQMLDASAADFAAQLRSAVAFIRSGKG